MFDTGIKIHACQLIPQSHFSLNAYMDYLHQQARETTLGMVQNIQIKDSTGQLVQFCSQGCHFWYHFHFNAFAVVYKFFLKNPYSNSMVKVFNTVAYYMASILHKLKCKQNSTFSPEVAHMIIGCFLKTNFWIGKNYIDASVQHSEVYRKIK